MELNATLLEIIQTRKDYTAERYITGPSLDGAIENIFYSIENSSE